MASYSYHAAQIFSDKLEMIRLNDPQGHEQIRELIESLLTDPSESGNSMHCVYQGRLKKYLGSRDYRIIYHSCNNCRKAKRLRAHCGSCGAVNDLSLVFEDVFHKKGIELDSPDLGRH